MCVGGWKSSLFLCKFDGLFLMLFLCGICTFTCVFVCLCQRAKRGPTPSSPPAGFIHVLWQHSVLKWGCSHQIFKLGDKERRREGEEDDFILGTGLIPATALLIHRQETRKHTHTHTLLGALCPHHIHIITQQLILFPKSRYLGLCWENPIGAAHFSICSGVRSHCPPDFLLSPSRLHPVCFSSSKSPHRIPSSFHP